jgi:hypothetical protein
MKIDRKGALAAPTHRVCVGPIASHIDSFAKFLADEGYARLTVTSKCFLVADLSQWLKRRRLPLAQLDERKLKQFYAHHRHSIRRGDVSTGRQLLELLRGLRVIAALPQKIDRTVLGQITQDYERFLTSQRGLAPGRGSLPIRSFPPRGANRSVTTDWNTCSTSI